MVRTKSSNASPCVVCEVELDHFTNNRKIPDYLCSKCFYLYKDQLDAPWLKYLMNQERYRRMKRQRRINAGIIVEEISMDHLSETGLTLPHTVLKDSHDQPERPKRRRVRQL